MTAGSAAAGATEVRCQRTFRSAREVPPRVQPRPSTPAAARGVAYENRVWRQLSALALAHGWTAQRHPLYELVLADGSRANAEPDALLICGDNRIIVVEVKLTYVPEAHIKLRDLYVPATEQIFGRPAVGLVICKHLVPGAPAARATLTEALATPLPLLHWLGIWSIRC